MTATPCSLTVSTMNALRAFAIALLVFAAGAQRADAGEQISQRALIVQGLHDWADAFNNRDLSHICDLFAPDLIATVPDAPNRHRAQVCENLVRVLTHNDRHLRYSSDIHEVIVSGKYAVVRLDWTLRVTRNGHVGTTLEHGLDVFEKDGHGTWSIIRFLAFSDASLPKV
jgi:ketosteroid isomerase-like protein